MKKNLFKLSFIILSISSANSFANPSCTETTVSGTVTTTNIWSSPGILPTVQTGTIHLMLTSDGGEEGNVFNETGGILGRITSQNLNEGTITLNHTVFFSEGNTLESMNDQAQIIAPTDNTYTSFYVTETINNFWGTRKFKGASGEIRAGEDEYPGIINYGGENTFELSGTICLK